MNKMATLHQYLIDQNLFRPEQMDSWVESCNLEPASKAIGQGMLLGRVPYVARFEIERFKGDALLILVLISTWLMENDDDRRDLDDPEVQIDVIDPRLGIVDLVIDIAFRQELKVVPAANGEISFNGQGYTLGEPTVYVADWIAVNHNPDIAPDLAYERHD